MSATVDSLENSQNGLIDSEALGSFQEEIRRHLCFTFGRHDPDVKAEYLYRALAIAVRDRMIPDWYRSQVEMTQPGTRTTYYVSMEFLIGRSLGNAVQNLDLQPEIEQALKAYGAKLEEVEEQELDAGLGNGGLGRLAACFLDSCANLAACPLSATAFVIEYGMFYQKIEDGRQIEHPDHWLRDGNPWEIERGEETRRIPFYGRTEHVYDADGIDHARWVDTNDVLAIPFDMPIPGYRNETVNTLRLWKASATDAFDLGRVQCGQLPRSGGGQEQRRTDHDGVVSQRFQ